MRLLLDTNVVLDVMLDRQPFALDSIKVVAAAESKKIDAFLCATTVTTIHYLSTKALGRKAAAKQIENLLNIFQIAPVTATILREALKSPGRDYEDAVLWEAARNVSADGIVTRNPVDFAKSALAIYLPRDLVAALNF